MAAIKTLLVDDDALLNMIMCSLLEREGFDVTVACNVAEALKRIGTKGPLSSFAANHGLTRRRQGFSAAMMVEKSRILQVCIFHTLEENLASIDFSVLLSQVMIIADEVDSQLRQAMECYVEESIIDMLPA